MIQLNSPTRKTAKELTREEEQNIVYLLNQLTDEDRHPLGHALLQRLIDNYESYQHHRAVLDGLWASEFPEHLSKQVDEVDINGVKVPAMFQIKYKP